MEARDKPRPNKSLVRVYFTLFAVGLATVILSIISSEHKESIAMFKGYDLKRTSPSSESVPAQPTYPTFEIIKSYLIAEPRFVEGLEFLDENTLLMSSGGYGNSHLEVIDIRTEPLQTSKTVALESGYFGEGITFMPLTREIIMLTYKKRKAFRFNLDLLLLDEMTIPTQIKEGWGMTHVGSELLVSDGTDRLFFV
jgi:glutamine cyclotransferase